MALVIEVARFLPIMKFTRQKPRLLVAEGRVLGVLGLKFEGLTEQCEYLRRRQVGLGKHGRTGLEQDLVLGKL